MRLAWAVALCALLSSPSFAAEIWYEDNNMGRAEGVPPDFLEKFQQPESFDEASRHIDVYMLRANVADDMDDAFFTDLLFPYLKQNDIALAIDAGGGTLTRASAERRSVSIANANLLDRIKNLGGRVDYLSLQSALSKPRRRDPTEYAISDRIEDIASFARSARAIFPDVSVGIIDALPAHGKDYQEPYRLLRDALAQEGIDLAYVHLDISFDAPRSARHGVTWSSIREIEGYVRGTIGAQFGLFAKSRRAGRNSDQLFHRRVIDTLECYAGAGGNPDAYILASWFAHPARTIPEDATGDDYPAMRTVLEFGRLLDATEAGGPAMTEDDRAWRRQCERAR